MKIALWPAAASAIKLWFASKHGPRHIPNPLPPLGPFKSNPGVIRDNSNDHIAQHDSERGPPKIIHSEDHNRISLAWKPPSRCRSSSKFALLLAALTTLAFKNLRANLALNALLKVPVLAWRAVCGLACRRLPARLIGALEVFLDLGVDDPDLILHFVHLLRSPASTRFQLRPLVPDRTLARNRFQSRQLVPGKGKGWTILSLLFLHNTQSNPSVKKWTDSCQMPFSPSRCKDTPEHQVLPRAPCSPSPALWHRIV